VSASFSFFAQSAPQTSILFPPTLIWMGSPSSLQSHAAQVLFATISLSYPETGMRLVSHRG